MEAVTKLRRGDLRPGQCRNTTGEDVKGSLYCGEPVRADGDKYCETCHRQVYRIDPAPAAAPRPLQRDRLPSMEEVIGWMDGKPAEPRVETVAPKSPDMEAMAREIVAGNGIEVGAELRAIEGIELDPDVRQSPPATSPPVFIDVDPRTLLVEPSYQRDLTPKSIALITKIAAGWDWRRFRPPVVVMTDGGGLILDGQHTAIAAASRWDLQTIPVQLVEASEVAQRAQAFIGLNTGHLAHSKVGLHKAAVAAGDVEACAIDRICRAAGVSIRQRYGTAKWRPGDTAAVTALHQLLGEVGERRAVIVLKALTAAGLAPIAANDIKAALMLVTSDEHAAELNPIDEGGDADLVTAIRALGADASREAGVFAKTHCVPLWRALGIVWFRKMKKRRKVA